MGRYEYNVIPTPRRAKRAKGFKSEPARFANVITEVINEQAASGWEYIKSETFPMEAKTSMFKSRIETFQTLMFFRREIETESEVLSMTPAPEPQVTRAVTATTTGAALTAPMAETETTKADVQNVLEEAGPEFSFEGENIDPLKNLVDNHRNDDT